MKIDFIKEREEYTLWRKRNRVRLSDVAKYSNCSISTISRWENGIINISNELLEKYNEYIEKFNTGEIYARNE